MIAIADAGLGNIASVANMLRRLGFDPVICSAAEQAVDCDRIIVPGVGAFDAGMAGLRSGGWVEFLCALSATQRVLGICLGMQLLSNGSDEGASAGLGLIPAHFQQFDAQQVTVPHMGWNEIGIVHPSSLLPATSEPQRFYFTHSYTAVCEDPDDVLATASHGGSFVAAYGRGNVYGVQFHPEKSHRFGMALLRRFVED